MQTYTIMSNALFLDGLFREEKYTIRDLPPDRKPRQKMLSQGPESLSIKELLAVVLNVGTVKEDVLEMSGRIIRDYGEKSILAEKDAKKLAKELNVSEGKACQIVATGELGRRFYDRSQSGFATLRTAKDVYEYLQDMRNLSKEHLRGLYLNSHNRVVRDVFRPAIESNAAAVILAHNHPSGEATPSEEDIEITKQLVQAGKIVGISLLDHVIITKNTFASISANY